MQDILNNREDLQNYLLATDDLNNSIQESLDLVVGNGHLNDRTAVWHESDLNPTTIFLIKITTRLMQFIKNMQNSIFKTQ